MNLTQEGDRLYLYSITTVAILGGLLFGYDTAVISGAEKGLEAFFLTATDFQYDKVMHGITSSSALIGCVIGGAISGYLASRLGRRDSLRLASVMFFLSALGSYYPEFLFFEYGKPNMDLLIAFNLYRVLGGIGVGLASAVCPMYIAEIAPSNIRGTLVSCNQFAIIFGMLVVYFVNYLIMGDHQNPIILKDAAGTALYGSRASNGVLVFETKKPKPGALTLSYSGNVGISVPDLSDYNLMNASEKLEYERSAGLFESVDMLNYYNKYKQEILRGVNTYWLSQPLRTALTHRHTLNMEGGDEAIRYSLSLNYGDEFGVMKGSDRNNVGLTLSLQYRRKKWNISNSLSMTNTKSHNSPYGSFSDYTKLNPYYRLTDENGRYQQVIEIKPMSSGYSPKTVTNPLYNVQFPNKDLSNNFSIVDNFSIEYAIMDNLRINGQVSLTKSTARSEQFKSSHHTDFANEEDLTQRGSYTKSTGESVNWNANAALNYNLVKGKHGMFALLRWDVSSSKSDGINLSAKGFPDDNMDDFLFAFEMDQRVNGEESTQRSVGMTGSLNYMYDQRFSVDFNIRGDLSSQFGADTKMAPFWSVGLRWNMEREKWLGEASFPI